MKTLLLVFAFALTMQTNHVMHGKVISITDGDTLKILVDNSQVTVRLDGIDAPEAKQSFGDKSKDALAKHVFGKTVRVRTSEKDKYGRTLGTVFVGQQDINAKMVQEGWAWHFKKYSKDENLAKLEIEAREAKRGLWADANALAPWEFRDRKSEPVAVAPVASSTSSATSTPSDEPKLIHWINSKSGVRHNRSCEHYGNTKSGRACSPTEGKACGKCGG
jgi:micrococcal nuclease